MHKQRPSTTIKPNSRKLPTNNNNKTMQLAAHAFRVAFMVLRLYCLHLNRREMVVFSHTAYSRQQHSLRPYISSLDTVINEHGSTGLHSSSVYQNTIQPQAGPYLGLYRTCAKFAVGALAPTLSVRQSQIYKQPYRHWPIQNCLVAGTISPFLLLTDRSMH